MNLQIIITGKTNCATVKNKNFSNLMLLYAYCVIDSQLTFKEIKFFSYYYSNN